MKKIFFCFFMVTVIFLASAIAEEMAAETAGSSDLPNIISIYGPSQVLYHGEKFNAASLGHWVVQFKEGKILLDGYSRQITEGALLLVEGRAFRIVWSDYCGWRFRPIS